jgi:hypothetical protein
MSWAKSVLPLFTGTSSETFRKVPDRVQIDTTLVRQNRVQNHALIRRHRLLNRTAVFCRLRRFRLFGQLPGRNKLKADSRLLVSSFPEIKFILSCCGVL